MIRLIFHEGWLLFYGVNRAHHSDVGGSTHDGCNPGANEIFQEGLRIRPLKLDDQGVPRYDLLQMLSANVGQLENFLGDPNAQIGSVMFDAQRIESLLADYGYDGWPDVGEVNVAGGIRSPSIEVTEERFPFFIKRHEFGPTLEESARSATALEQCATWFTKRKAQPYSTRRATAWWRRPSGCSAQPNVCRNTTRSLPTARNGGWGRRRQGSSSIPETTSSASPPGAVTVAWKTGIKRR